MIQYLKLIFSRQPFLKRNQPIVHDLVNGTASYTNQMMVMMFIARASKIITCDPITKV